MAPGQGRELRSVLGPRGETLGGSGGLSLFVRERPWRARLERVNPEVMPNACRPAVGRRRRCQARPS